MATTTGIMASFPVHQYPHPLPNQEAALTRIERVLGDRHGVVTLEVPTGSGKTAVGFTFLMHLAKQGKSPLFYVVPTKTLVEQVKLLHPEVTVALGRNAHDCLYYPGQGLKADEIPCALLTKCPHRVDQQTGALFEPGAVACPYLLQKYEAKQANIVVCTTAFYLFTQLFSKEWQQPAGLVVDEAHRIAQIVRGCLSFEISDWHILQAADLLMTVGAQEHQFLRAFLRKLIHIVGGKPRAKKVLLADEEIASLYEALLPIDPNRIREQVGAAIARGAIKPIEHREVLNQIQVLIRDLRRYLASFEFSLPAQRRHALNYTYAFHEPVRGGDQRVHHKVVVRSYHVAPLIERILGARTVAFSATIGDERIFGNETGIKGSFERLPAAFDSCKTRVFMPVDTPNLASRERKKSDVGTTLRMFARACRRFAAKGHRSLVVVVSEVERQQFLELAQQERVNVISYGNGVASKDAASRFKSGEGDVLLGTVANYGEGIDLPRETAPVIFFLRPSYPRPDDPQTVFEERRFGGSRWGLWNWRVMVEALQVRGRNIRSENDLGVTFFGTQQFRRFLFHALPDWLKPAYRGEKTFDQCVKEAMELLG